MATFVVLALAALIGLISRMTTVETQASFVGVESLNLTPGQAFGSARFDGIASKNVPSLRLRMTECGEPIYATPLELKSVAVAELADDTYLNRPGYAATNVYHGQVRQTFSHFARIFARNPLTSYRIDYFVRFYAPAHCMIDDQAYINWAGMILAMGTRVAAISEGN